MTIRLYKICGKPTGKKQNAKYCNKCAEVLKKEGVYRYKIGNNIWVWVRGTLRRVIIDGKEVEPILECYEIL